MSKVCDGDCTKAKVRLLDAAAKQTKVERKKKNNHTSGDPSSTIAHEVSHQGCCWSDEEETLLIQARKEKGGLLGFPG